MSFYFFKMSHKTVIIDEIMSQLDAAKSGVVPGSVCQAVVSGIQNVPSQITQSRMMSTGSSSAYTTFPLSPIVKNCCLDKSYLNMEFDINFKLHVEGTPTSNATYKIPFYFGLRDNASMFNQLQILIENSAIWTTTYQREESVLSYNSLPETEIRGNNQYSSIQKMMDAEYSPMKRVIVPVTLSGGHDTTNASGDYDVIVHFKTTIDINRLTPLLSNLHYTTPHFGNMRLKVFLQDFAKCLFFCPDYNYISNASNTSFAEIGSQFCNQYWSFYPLSEFANRRIPSTQIPFYGWNTLDNKMSVFTSITFTDPAPGTDFMTFAHNGTAEIVQTCFDIREEEYQRLTDYFASIGSIIIPSQTWSSSVFNNSGVVGSQNWPESQIGNVGGYNIDFISVWQHPEGSPCCFNKEFLNNVQLILDGRPINSLPYAYINDKCITDTTQAIIDTDHEEINKDYIHSLTFLNVTDTQRYLDDAASVMYGTGQVNSSIRRKNLINPNTFSLNFSTNLPDAFHSGACVLENSNRQAVIRFNSTNQQTTGQFTHERNKFPFYITSNVNKDTQNINSQSTTTGFSTFCDCCIVLTYDPARQTSYDGQLSWAAPYI